MIFSDLPNFYYFRTTEDRRLLVKISPTQSCRVDKHTLLYIPTGTIIERVESSYKFIFGQLNVGELFVFYYQKSYHYSHKVCVKTSYDRYSLLDNSSEFRCCVNEIVYQIPLDIFCLL